jgi:hypothetical protein
MFVVVCWLWAGEQLKIKNGIGKEILILTFVRTSFASE